MRLTPMVCAHRGRSEIVPENTMAAYEAAIEIEADFMELDVRRTADGTIVCIHDPTVERTTDGAGEVEELTLDELRALDAGAWKGEEYAGERIPLLSEVLEQIAPRLVIDIEIKQRGIAEQVVEEIQAAEAVRRVSVVSFDTDDLRTVRSAQPRISCGFITSGPEDSSAEAARDLIDEALECGAGFISCHHANVAEVLVRECHLMGMILMAWTMDEREDIQRMIDLRVDALVSNLPGRVIEMLGGDG